MSEIFFFHFREAPVQCSSAFGNWAEASENNGAVVMCADFVPTDRVRNVFNEALLMLVLCAVLGRKSSSPSVV